MHVSLLALMAFIYSFTLIAGYFFEKKRIPWVIAALFAGFILSYALPGIQKDEAFSFMAEMGMFFLLFVVGLEMNVKEFVKMSGKYLNATIFILFSEAIIGGLFYYFVFGTDICVSLLVGLSFATVGEAVLVPILDEFNVLNTALGHTVVGVGVLDDLAEIFVLALVATLSGGESIKSTVMAVISLVFLLFAFVLFKKLHARWRFSFPKMESVVLTFLSLLFIFVLLGEYADAGPLGALLAGIAVRAVLPERKLEHIEDTVKAICYGVFAPVFFAWVGAGIDISYVLINPIILFALVFVTALSKIIPTYYLFKDYLGKDAITAGIALCTRFSTGLIVAQILFSSNIIPSTLYSLLISATAVYVVAIPLIVSYMLAKRELKTSILKTSAPR